MKILVASDFHGHLSVIEEMREKAISNKVGAIVVCGDITHHGTIPFARDVLEKLSIEGVVTLFVPGNMDPKELVDMETINGAQNLHGRSRKVAAMNFMGVGGCILSPFNTLFEMSEQKLRKVLDEASQMLDDEGHFILVSHNPPFNTKVDITSFGAHVGSKSLRSFIEETMPLLTLCGHIHEARAIDKIEETLVVNPGPAFKGFYALIDLNKEVLVELSS